MGSKSILRICGMAGCAASMMAVAHPGGVVASEHAGRTANSPAEVRACRVASIEGEAKAGQAFERSIGNGLKLRLEPIASGWVLRVVTALGPREGHDYAELATPPYRSVSPLLISTDFSFRAQDVVAWNPRHFRFAQDRSTFNQLMIAYRDADRLAGAARDLHPSAVETSRLSNLRSVETRMAALVARSPEGELMILDAGVVQGTADQAQTAAMVASHLSRSAHRVEQAADGKATPLGRVNWIRFRIRLDLSTGFHAEQGLSIERSGCLS